MYHVLIVLTSCSCDLVSISHLTQLRTSIQYLDLRSITQEDQIVIKKQIINAF